ncbi:MAG TPA: hypothetical protein VFQ61_21380 [Polyangiaceae bacterium]|nr:hypothetical protein [Polyangiaceae bacterium]
MHLGSRRALSCVGLAVFMLACSSDETASRPRGGGTGGARPGGLGGSGSIPIPGNGGTGPVLPGGGQPSLPNGPVSGGVVPDDDPSNPNITHPTCDVGTCADFPEQPIMGEGVPANAPTLFGADPAAFTAGTLCVLEPQLSNGSTPGTMIPANWVRPRFKFNAMGANLFEIRIKNAAQKHELVAYTTKTTWYMPKEIWAGNVANSIAAGSGAANNGAGAPFEVTIRGVNTASPGTPVGVKGEFHVAPVVATGSMVFWTVNSAVVTPESSKLLGFAVGDEGVAETVTLKNVRWTGQIGENGATLRGYYDKPKVAGFTDGQVRCIGCHTSTPDGLSVIFTDDWPWPKAVASVSDMGGAVGAVPTWLTPGARALLKLPWLGTQTMSKAHWKQGDRIMVTSYGVKTKNGKVRDKPWYGLDYDNNDRIQTHQLAWFDLEANITVNDTVALNAEEYGEKQDARNNAVTAAQGKAWGLIATGDTQSAVSPSFKNDGTAIVYTVTDYTPDGHPDYTGKVADIKTVSFGANRAGGTGQPVKGASEANYLEYYPSYSADDKFIAFTRAPAVSSTSPDGPYYNRFGEIMVVPSEGGTATPLAANAPNSCAGDNVQRGIINSWPKWSPDVFKAHGKTYYFAIFSSARKYGDEFSTQFQLPTSTASAFQGLTDSSQLWLAAIVVDESGNITTYPAQYIWNQNRLAAAGGAATNVQFSNLTPAWDPFVLPPITIAPPGEPPR